MSDLDTSAVPMSERGPYTPKPPTVMPKPVFVSRTVSVRQDHHDAIAARAAVQGRAWSAVLRDVLTAGLRALGGGE